MTRTTAQLLCIKRFLDEIAASGGNLNAAHDSVRCQLYLNELHLLRPDEDLEFYVLGAAEFLQSERDKRR